MANWGRSDRGAFTHDTARAVAGGRFALYEFISFLIPWKSRYCDGL